MEADYAILSNITQCKTDARTEPLGQKEKGTVEKDLVHAPSAGSERLNSSKSKV